MGGCESKKVVPASNVNALPVIVDNPNAEMIDLPEDMGSHPRFQVGVTAYFFPWLKEFIEKECGDKFPKEISTEQLVKGRACAGSSGSSPMKWCIYDQTQSNQCSFLVWCIAKGYAKDKEGRPLFAPVTTFVSHAWKGSFIALEKSISSHCEMSKSVNGDNNNIPAFFLDIFVVNQHTPPWKETPTVGMDYALKQPIQLSLKTLLVMSPFEDPVPLKRAWCIYEVCNTKRLGASLDIAMPEIERKRFVDALKLGEFDFNDWITNIDIEKAGAYDPNDKKMIMDLVLNSPGSTHGLNRTVVKALCEWLSVQGYIALEEIPEQERGTSALLMNLANVIWRQGKPNEAEPLYKEVVRSRRKAFGDNDVRTLAGLHIWGRFLRAKGSRIEALEILKEAASGRENVVGKGHEDTLTSKMELAEVYRGMNELKDAEDLIRDVISGWRDIFGKLGKSTIRSEKEMHFLNVNFLESLKVQAAILLQKGQGNRSDEEISSILTELYDGRVDLFGSRNPATLDAVVLRSQHRLSTNAASENDLCTLEDTLEVLRGSLGDTHPRTLNCMVILARVLSLLKNDGLGLVNEAVDGYSKTLGLLHPDTQAAVALQENIAGINDRLAAQNVEADDCYNACFCPGVRVLLADGTATKSAKDIKVGDKVCAIDDNGKRTTAEVLGHIIQEKDSRCRDLIQIGDMLISEMHRIQHKGCWMRPVEYPEAVKVHQPCELHNFVVRNSLPIVVNDIVVSTIGTYCNGLHDMRKPKHKLWASQRIVNVFQSHPQWPLVVLKAREDNFLSVVKSSAFSEEYVKDAPKNREKIQDLLTKNGWKYKLRDVLSE